MAPARPPGPNPWLDIPLADYEGHMSLPSVAQAPYLSRVLTRWVESIKPVSVAVLGCAGGNGFEGLPPSIVHRVVGVDINSSYLAAVAQRFEARFDTLQLIGADILSPACTFAPVQFVFGALIFEYVDPGECLRKIRGFLATGGKLGVILQQQSTGHAAITPTPFKSLQKLDGCMKLVPPEEFKKLADEMGYRRIAEQIETLPTGKSFTEILFTHDR